MQRLPFIYNDGGRKDAGFDGSASDCVCRAIAIVTGRPYKEIYDALAIGNATQRKVKYGSKKSKEGKLTASHGISTKRKWFNDYMLSLGFEWVPTMQIGEGCTTHLLADELPTGRLVVSLSKHMAAVVNGVLHDIYDCSREGSRCVYGYYILNDSKPSHKGVHEQLLGRMLRPYQQTAVDFMASGAAVIEMPAGVGKTAIMDAVTNIQDTLNTQSVLLQLQEANSQTRRLEVLLQAGFVYSPDRAVALYCCQKAILQLQNIMLEIKNHKKQ